MANYAIKKLHKYMKNYPYYTPFVLKKVKKMCNICFFSLNQAINSYNLQLLFNI